MNCSLFSWASQPIINHLNHFSAKTVNCEPLFNYSTFHAMLNSNAIVYSLSKLATKNAIQIIGRCFW